MKRLILSLAVLLVIPAAADARSPNPPPDVDVSVAKAHPDRVRSNEYVIAVDAIDPNGMMSELMIDLGDGAVVWMLLACPDTPGEPVTQEITWTYAPGEYTIRASGFSTTGCFSGPVQESREDSVHLIVP
ncbi:MAG: hypothetical protein ACRDKS_09095 [Actinomycetota bacterium]